ncbi:hypothetical protein DFH06DRAFT_1464913 [Mycena polygramma]|nr:hypothetical protein DFH06DRAFT_1464913 [Mycena polygramma]
MFTVSQTFTLLQAWFGDAVLWFLSLFSRGGVKVDDAESASTVVGSDVDMKSAECDDVALPAPVPEVESIATEPEKDEPTGPELISAAVAASLATLPSLPSILKTPEARPPPPTSSNAVSEKQDFGPPTNLFYEHRLPFGNVTNLPRFGAEQKGMRVNNFEVKPLAPRVKSRKSRAKKSRAFQVPAVVVVDTDAPEVSSSAAAEVLSTPALKSILTPVATLDSVAPSVFASILAPVKVLEESVPALVNVLESVTAPVKVMQSVSTPVTEPIAVLEPTTASVKVFDSAATAAPGSADWERSKAAALAQAQAFSTHVKLSRRISLPSPAPIPVPAAVDTIVLPPSKRHSAPPVLCAPRKTLQDRLSALLAATTDTIAALETEKVSSVKGGVNGVPEIGDAIKEAKRFSAAALEEGRQLFTVGVDSDDEDNDDEKDNEDEDDIPLGQLLLTGKARQVQSASVLPTVNPASPRRLISSISASRSMADLANASSRSINELCNGYDQAMSSPVWQRLLARSDDINRRRRNDSIV